MTSLVRTPSAIDVRHLPAPTAIEVPEFDTLRTAFTERFLAEWEIQRTVDPTLALYDVEMLDSDPAMIAARAWTFLRLLDRFRVNDAVKAVLPAFSKGTNLDQLVAGANVVRKVIQPADPSSSLPAVLETDEQLLRRYLAAFDAPAAGSADGFIYRAVSAWPAMHDCAPLGYAIHGRRGEIDIVVAGPAGRAPTVEEHSLVRAAVTAESAHPASTHVSVINAQRTLYTVELDLLIPPGPDPSLVRATALAAVRAAADDRTKIGAEVPLYAVAGAAYSANVIRVTPRAPLMDVPANPYAIPVCTDVSITVAVQQ